MVITHYIISFIRLTVTLCVRQRVNLISCTSLLLACSYVPVHAQPREIDRSLFIQMSASFAKVEAVLANGQLNLGTGVTVDKEWIATNCHVTRNSDDLHIVKGGVRFPVTAQLVDEKHDICLLKVPRWPGKAVSLSSTKGLVRGLPVVGLGYVGGIELSMRSGVIADLHLFDHASVIQTDAAFTSGASGGGLFDSGGRLLGLMTFRLKGGNNHYFVVPVDWIEILLSQRGRESSGIKVANATSFWESIDDKQPHFLKAISSRQSRDWFSLRVITDSWVQTEPESADAWFNNGEAHFHLGDASAALRKFAQAVALDSHFSEAWFGLGESALHLGNKDKIQESLDQLNKLNKDLAQRLRNLLANHPNSH